MNKQQLFAAGSVLLATTSLAGVANAAVVSTNGVLTGGAALGGTTFTGAKIANTIFSTTASTANAVTIGSTAIYVAFSNNFTPSTKFSVELDPINATFVTTNVNARLLISNAGSFAAGATTIAATGNCTSITPLTTKIILDGCGGSTVASTNGAGTNVSSYYAGVEFSGVSFNNASGLAAVGATIGVNGVVYNPANASSVYENITAATVVTSAAPVVITVTSGGTSTVNASATPVAFSYFTSTDYVTMSLAFVTVTGAGVLAADLTSVVIGGGAAASAQQSLGVSSINVSVASTALSQAAATSVSVKGSGLTAIYNGTVANFSGGVATFSVNSAAGFDSFAIQVSFSGTAAISAASAGTVTVTPAAGQVVGGGTLLGQASPAVTGKTGTISLGGFNAELNTFLTSANTAFSSFARIHNNGTVAAVATVTVRNDATGVTMGTYTTASIATNQTLQISAKDIETGAGITPAAGVNYTLSINGPFSGYAQHIIFNPLTGQLADLSSFRNRGGATTSP